MSVSSCSDFCTAEKCDELLRRIEALEEELATHKTQPIPVAHDYSNKSVNSVTVQTYLQGNDLTVEVAVDDKRGSDTVDLPVANKLQIDTTFNDNTLTTSIELDDLKAESSVNLSPTVALDINPQENGNLLFKSTVNGISDVATLAIEDLHQKSNLSINGSFTGNTLHLIVADGESEGTTDIVIPLTDISELKKSNLKINGSYHDGTLNLTVSDGQSSSSFNVDIPRYGGGGGGQEHIPSNLSGTATYETNILTISIADGESQTAFQTEILTMDKETKKKIEVIYAVLGGDTWQVKSDGSLTLPVEPEKLIREVGGVLYSENSESLTPLTVTNLLELFTAFSTVDFYRSGHHRLPAAVLPSLANNAVSEDNQESEVELEKLYDVLSFQEWTVKQIDALVGEFPLKITTKRANPDNNETEETEMVMPNISEAIAELIALNLAISQDADLAVNISMKGLVEARNAANAAITAVDYGSANAQYLGYKGNQYKREVPLTFTPGASSLAAALKPSTKSIVGWKNEDKETLIEILKKTLISAEIVKAALFHPYQPGGSVAGDAVTESVQQQQETDNQQWSEFVNRVNNPAGRYNVPKPKAKIKDLSVDQ